MRGHFMWRVGCGFFFFVIFVVAFFALLAWVIGAVTSGDPPWVAVVLIGILVLFLLSGVARAVRRAAVPVGDLIEASERMEGGDFSARVPERGPREVRSLARAFNSMSSRLEEVERQRQSTLADVSHEMRTPLAVIQGNVEALIDGIYPADAEHLEPILQATRDMERLIEDLRTLSLAEAHRLVLHREPTDLGTLLPEVVAGYRSQADEAGIQLIVTVVEAVPVLNLDPARLREVVGNLLANALRHTPSGGSVDLAARLVGNEVEVTVRDTGPGMEPHELDRIFERFYRSPDSPGSGLGLSIARDLVEAHGGTITATSAAGQGTTVRFTVPR
ncbi:MAG TPA: HAMP domain-containing sensor histidine kinase [Candidatus Limnocylindria bacterium]|nr:HAMP domain-containing sensor histidine kinase [Candidatus Limnocylindria bacterium]